MAKRIISYDDLKNKGINYSKPHLWRLERDRKFPKRVQTGDRRYGYVEEEIDAYIEARIRARDNAARAAA